MKKIFKWLKRLLKISLLSAIGKCSDDHCYNGHALLTFGVIP